MLRIKKILFLAIIIQVLLSLRPYEVNAQLVNENYKPDTKSTPAEDKANELTRWMQRNLILTIDQFATVGDVNLIYAHKQDSVDKVIKDKQIRNSVYAKLKQKKDAAFKEILTDSQFTQYLQHKDLKIVLKRSPFGGNYQTE